jgi:hypothetical protein
MSAQIFVLRNGETLKLAAPRGASVRVRSGDVWFTQDNDWQDYILRTNHALALRGEGFTIITAYEPTVLELHRQDPFVVREAVEREVNGARSEAICAFFTRLFYLLLTRESI